MNIGDETIERTQRQMKYGSVLTLVASKYALAYTFNKLRNAEPKLVTGNVKMRKLTANTRSVKTLDVPDIDMKQFEGLCKKYGVMYNAVKEKDNTRVAVFYREEDTERIQKALDNIVRDIAKDNKEIINTNIENKTITKEEIENIQNRFENILKEPAKTDVVIDNSIEGISDLTKIKKELPKEKTKIPKTEKTKVKKELTEMQKKALYRDIGGR